MPRNPFNHMLCAFVIIKKPNYIQFSNTLCSCTLNKIRTRNNFSCEKILYKCSHIKKKMLCEKFCYSRFHSKLL